jgi:retinol dehydrogenase-12
VVPTSGVPSILIPWLAIQQATGFNNAELALVDLSKFAPVSAFADAFTRDGSQIDILVYNAGVAFPHYVSTGDGWEEM